MPTAREIDDNGFMTVRGCPISSFGIFEYSAGQLDLPGDPNRIVNVFRPESAVSDPEAIRSFQRVPLIDDHEMLSGFDGDEGATAPEDYGIDGVLTGVDYSRPWMVGDLTLYTRRIKKALDSGKQELSLGYSCDFEEKTGTFEGRKYEAIQTNMRGNHIALVDKARVSGARVLDSAIVKARLRKVSATDSRTGNSFSQASSITGKFFVFDGFSVNFQSEGDNMKRGSRVTTKRNRAADSAVEELRALLPKLLPALQEFMTEESHEPEHQGAGGGEGGEGEQGQSNMGGEGNANAENPNAGNANAGEHGEGEHEDEGFEGGEGQGPELSDLIAQAEALIAQLKAATSEPGNVEDRSGEGGDEEGENGQEGENAGDVAQGLASGGEHCIGADRGARDEGEGRDIPQNGGKAPAGPGAGVHAKAGDAALRRFYADSAVKNRLYDRLSKVVGTFDCATLDASQVAAYGVKKLGLRGIAKGHEIAAVDSYLTALERSNKARSETVRAQAAQDSASADKVTDAYAAFMNGTK